MVLNAYKKSKGARFKHIFLNIILYGNNYLLLHLLQPYLYLFFDDINPKYYFRFKIQKN